MAELGSAYWGSACMRALTLTIALYLPQPAPLGGRGAAEAGYTLREAAALARSSLPGHRVAACRLLGAVLARARAMPADALRGALGGAARALKPPAGAAAADVRPRRPARRGTCGHVALHGGAAHAVSYPAMRACSPEVADMRRQPRRALPLQRPELAGAWLRCARTHRPALLLEQLCMPARRRAWGG